MEEEMKETKREHRIDLSAVTPFGKAQANLSGETLEVWTTHSVTSISFNLYEDSHKRHYVSIPGMYRLPFCLDMTVKLDHPALFLLVGSGHITFASPSQDNRKIEDMIKPSGKPNQDHGAYDNSLPFGEYVDISVIYNLSEMQILIGGEERFHSCKQAYMRIKKVSRAEKAKANKNKPSQEQKEEGIAIGLAVPKLSMLSIRSIKVTEYDEQVPVVRGAHVEATNPGRPKTVQYEEGKTLPAAREQVKNHPPAGERAKVMEQIADRPKPTFESILSELPQAFHGEIQKTDQFLLSLRPLKLKRTVEKNGSKFTYVASDFGVSYAVNVSGAQSSHQFGWYIVYNGKPETWHRKADDMEETLAYIAESDPPLAERIFYALNDCVGCYGSGCLAKTLYAFNGEKRVACHGRVMLRMRSSDFRDVRAFFHHLNALMERRMAEGIQMGGKIFVRREEKTL